MSYELTFSILKPDAVERRISGKINDILETVGLRIIAQKMIHMTKMQAEEFYAVHKERSFFSELVDFITSGPVIVQVLGGDAAVHSYRNIMGATNPIEAKEGTIRKIFAESIGRNCVHGSDSFTNAEKEIKQFFSENEIFKYLDKYNA